MTGAIVHDLTNAAGRDAVERGWLAAIRTGDEAAFEQLFRAYAAPLASYAYAQVRSRDLAQDVVQQLFCWLWEHRHSLEVPRSVRAYLYTATRNRAINHIRSERREIAFRDRVVQEAIPDERPEPGAIERLYATDLGVAVARALNELTPRCREVFMLSRDRGLTYGEIAAVVGISQNTVEIHMSRALAALRARLAGWRMPDPEG